MWVKICGVTCVDDATLAADLGADAIGVNLVPSSKRAVDEAAASAIVDAVGARVKVVAVVADRPPSALLALRARLGVHALQLHGDETRAELEALLPHAFKAVRIGDADDAARAAAWPGEELLVDAKVAGALGGTGAMLDWTLVRALSASRRVILAGGLTPDNVARAIATARPWGVDVASGVERAGDARRKDAARVRDFVIRARAAGGTE